MADIQKVAAQVVGVLMTIVGIPGFFVGADLLGFGINILHSIIHLGTGLAGIWAGFKGGEGIPRLYNKWIGVTYILVFILGIAVPDLMLQLLNINMADNILHLLLGAALAVVGFGIKS